MHGMLRGVVAVDGPSGTGKSTTARGLAMRLDARYLDTGAMYRAATLAVLRSDVPLDVAKTAAEGNDDVVAVALGARVELSTDPAEPRVRLDGEDVDAEIRGTEVTAAVSAVSALTAVREHLVDEQRRIVAEVVEDGGGIVVEGRDIGTVVTPDAGLKVFLTASELVRAGRRDAENTAAGRAGDTGHAGRPRPSRPARLLPHGVPAAPRGGRGRGRHLDTGHRRRARTPAGTGRGPRTGHRPRRRRSRPHRRMT